MMYKKIGSMLMFAGLLLGSCKKAPETSFFIPVGYEGPLLVLFGVENGCTNELNNGKHIFMFDNNGVSCNSFRFSLSGILDQEFFYVDEQGEIVTNIPIASSGLDSDDTAIRVMIDGTKYLSKDENMTSKSDLPAYRFLLFYVGKNKNNEALNKELDAMKTEEHILQVIQDCNCHQIEKLI